MNQELSSSDIIGEHKKDKVREENNKGVLVSSGGSSLRTPAGLVWLRLCGHYSKEVSHTCKNNSYSLNVNELSFGRRRENELPAPFFISLPPCTLARKHILKLGRPVGLSVLTIVGEHICGNQLLSLGSTYHHNIWMRSPLLGGTTNVQFITDLAHASFNHTDCYAMTCI